MIQIASDIFLRNNYSITVVRILEIEFSSILLRMTVDRHVYQKSFKTSLHFITDNTPFYQFANTVPTILWASTKRSPNIFQSKRVVVSILLILYSGYNIKCIMPRNLKSSLLLFIIEIKEWETYFDIIRKREYINVLSIVFSYKSKPIVISSDKLFRSIENGLWYRIGNHLLLSIEKVDIFCIKEFVINTHHSLIAWWNGA